MLVRGASADPVEAPPAVANTPPASHKRKHSGLETDEVDAVEPSGAPDIVLARDTSRPRLTVSRHPVFLPSVDGSPYQMTELCAVNRTLDKVGFKYVPAGLADPDAAIPYRTIESIPMSTRVSWEDRSPFIRVTQDGLGLAGAKGFRSARTNVGVQEGKWYLEVKVIKGGGDGSSQVGPVRGSHVRLGWGRREAPLNGPVGLDGYSYGVRDKTGDKVTLSRPRPYGKAFGTGDVVGLYISLPPRRKPDPRDPDDPAHIHRERIAIDFKGQEYFESLDYPQSKEMLSLMDHPSRVAKADPPQAKKSATVKNLPSDRGRNKPVLPKVVPQRPLPILQDSKIAFFVNGECQGVAFRDLYDYLQLHPPPGSRKNREKQRRNRDGPREHTENHFDDGTLGYYPFFSLFGDAKIQLNPGPDFAFPPPPNIDVFLSGEQLASDKRTWRPMSDRYPEFMSQQWVLDVKEEAEAKGETVEEKPALDDGQEEKLRLKRERKRKSEAARRKRLKEEKIAAAAAAAAASGSLNAQNALPGLSSNTGSSPAPSLAPSSSGADIDVNILYLASALRMAAANAPQEHQQPISIDILREVSVPQTPQGSDFGGVAQQENCNNEAKDDKATVEFGLKQASHADAPPNGSEGSISTPSRLGFEESSTRWTDRS